MRKCTIVKELLWRRQPHPTRTLLWVTMFHLQAPSDQADPHTATASILKTQDLTISSGEVHCIVQEWRPLQVPQEPGKLSLRPHRA